MRPHQMLTVLLLLMVLAVPAAVARIAVFVDGRVLKVDDAYLEEDRIVLCLPGGGKVTVPATRIERVVADEVIETDPEPLPVERLCSPDWENVELPDRTPFRGLIQEAARQANIHPWLLASLVQAESAFDAAAESRAGARGLTQLMPAAAADYGVTNIWDPEQNLHGGASHLRRLLDRFESLPLALAAYNSGATTVERCGGVPPYRETRGFVRRVMVAFCPDSAVVDETSGTTTAGPGYTLPRGGDDDR